MTLIFRFDGRTLFRARGDDDVLHLSYYSQQPLCTMSSASSPTEVKEKVLSVLGWPTDVVSVDYCSRDSPSNTSDWPQPDFPRTVLIFVPGNPGCIGWYTPNLVELVTRLGLGFAARGISYAGHGTDEEITDVQRWIHSKERDTNIPWTVNGQIRHKVAYLDMLISEFRDQGDEQNLPHFIFLSHSIGSHMVQRLLVLRPDILERTVMNVQLMPFTRMDAPRLKQTLLDLAASSPGTLIGVTQRILQVLKFMPYEWVDCLMKSALDDEAGRTLAVRLVRQPLFARNFFELGTEEIRDVRGLIIGSFLALDDRPCF
jgi:pimeloyl-ACP methyl ester carboxylesterase